MGSVKDLHVIVPPTENDAGKGVFDFSQRYSVFDWGQMPDEIPNKGAALCLMGAFNFEALNQLGVETHYQGLLDVNGRRVSSIAALTEPAHRMVVELSKVVHPPFGDGQYDYSFFTGNRGHLQNVVVPLEVIYRNGLPMGSSVFRKIEKLEKEGKTQELRTLYSKLGLTEKPTPGQMLPHTVFDFTTKFESTDRALSNEVAYHFSGLSEEQFAQLKDIRRAGVEIVGIRAKVTGFKDWDGKHEYRFYNGRVGLADVFGTLDENRFTINIGGKDIQVSKEFLRQYHKKHQKEWYEDTERAKEYAKRDGVEDWTTLTLLQPQKLDSKLVNLVGEMYASASNRYIGRDLFKGVRPLERVMEDLLPYME